MKSASLARFAALDIFRGLCIVGMVLVNTPGDPTQVFAPLRHAEWHGWTLADLVAPGFLWIVGVTIPLAIGKHLNAGSSPALLQLRILRRAAILYAVGALLDSILNLDYLMRETARFEFPVLGILQRIAICYLVAASAWLWDGLPGAAGTGATCLGLYIGIICMFSFTYDLADPFAPKRNFAAWAEGLILGSTFNSSQALVTTLTGTVTTLSGVAMGHYIDRVRSPTSRTSWILLLVGATSIGLGQTLATWIPINRHLWTPSFVLLTSGISILLLIALSYLAHWRPFTQIVRPLVVIGHNPIVIFALATILGSLLAAVGANTPYQDDWISIWTLGYHQFLNQHLPPKVASLTMTLAFIMVLYCVAWFLDHRRWIISI